MKLRDLFQAVAATPPSLIVTAGAALAAAFCYAGEKEEAAKALAAAACVTGVIAVSHEMRRAP